MTSPFFICGMVYVNELPLAPPFMFTALPVLDHALMLLASRLRASPEIVSFTTTFLLRPRELTETV